MCQIFSIREQEKENELGLCMDSVLAEYNQLSYILRGAIYETYMLLGPGLLESVYEAALEENLSSRGLLVECQVPVGVTLKTKKLDIGFRLDLLVEKRIIVEVKSVEHLSEVHHKQLLTYLKLTGCKLGILVNFNSADIEKSIFRKVNGFPG